MDPAISVAKTLDGEDRENFARILVDSFPPAERDDPEELLGRIGQGGRSCLVAYDDSALIGFAVLLDLRSVDAVLLEYIAVSRDARDRGVGGHLLRTVLQQLSERSTPPAGLVLEVERPEPDRAGERTLRRRRIEFYERHGARMVGGESGYRVPSTNGTGILRYCLMWIAIGESRPLDTSRLRNIASAILVNSYHLNADDAFVRSVVADLVA